METIKDFYNRIIGYIETKPNGVQTGYDFYRRIVGYYQKNQNITTDFYRRVVGRGNILTSLIAQAETENRR